MKNYIKLILLILLLSIIVPIGASAEENISIKKNVEEDVLFMFNDFVLKEEEQNIVVPFETIEIEDNDLEVGVRKVLTEGIDGINIKLYRLVLQDDLEISRKSMDERVDKKPMNKVILIGTKKKPKIKKETLYFITNNVHLKKEPTENSDTLITIPNGTHLQHISTDADWHKVSYNEKTGYIDVNLVKQASGYKVDDTLIVNKGYGLSEDFNPGVNPEALDAVNLMIKDAKESDINLNIFSDFRNYSYQRGVYDKRVKKNGKKKVEMYYSRPGYSEHQTGLAFDIGGPNSSFHTSQKFGQTKEGLWLAENSYKYGLIIRYAKGKEDMTGYQYEPWHFRYVGVDLAKRIQESGLTLDEYFHVVKTNY